MPQTQLNTLYITEPTISLSQMMGHGAFSLRKKVGHSCGALIHALLAAAGTEYQAGAKCLAKHFEDSLIDPVHKSSGFRTFST